MISRVINKRNMQCGKVRGPLMNNITHANLTISLLVPRCPYKQLLCGCGNIVIAMHTASIGLILHVHTWNRSLELFKQYIQTSVVAVLITV